MAELSAKERGVPTLLQQLSAMVGESVYLWYTPPPAAAELRWRVWSGVPTGSGGGEWGRGSTPSDALHTAYSNVVASIFDGRMIDKQAAPEPAEGGWTAEFKLAVRFTPGTRCDSYGVHDYPHKSPNDVALWLQNVLCHGSPAGVDVEIQRLEVNR